jgi:hypothetical protein
MGKKTWQRFERNERELKERLERVEKEGTQEDIERVSNALIFFDKRKIKKRRKYKESIAKGPLKRGGEEVVEEREEKQEEDEELLKERKDTYDGAIDNINSAALD